MTVTEIRAGDRKLTGPFAFMRLIVEKSARFLLAESDNRHKSRGPHSPIVFI
jgi:hypothetical protein